MRTDYLPPSIAAAVNIDGAHPYFWCFPFDTTIQEGGNGVVSLVNDGKYFFEWLAITGHAWLPTGIASGVENYGDLPRVSLGNANTVATGNFIEMQIQVGNMLLNNTPAPFYSMVGSAEHPFWMPRPYIIAPQDSVDITLYNRTAETDHDIRANVCLIGTRYPRR